MMNYNLPYFHVQVDYKFIVAVLIEYIRSLSQHGIPVLVWHLTLAMRCLDVDISNAFLVCSI